MTDPYEELQKIADIVRAHYPHAVDAIDTLVDLLGLTVPRAALDTITQCVEAHKEHRI